AARYGVGTPSRLAKPITSAAAGVLGGPTRPESGSSGIGRPNVFRYRQYHYRRPRAGRSGSAAGAVLAFAGLRAHGLAGSRHARHQRRGTQHAEDTGAPGTGPQTARIVRGRS